MATKKRKPSAYNLHIAREMKDGKTMAEAAASYPRHGALKKRKPSKKRRSKKNPKTGIRGSYKSGGLDISGEYNLADAMAGLAFLGGLGGFFLGPPGWAASAILLSGSGYYFGINYIFPQHEAQKKLLTANNNPPMYAGLPVPKMIARQPVQSAAIGASAAGVAWVAWRMNERRKLVNLLQQDHGIRAIRSTFKGRLPPSEIAWTVEPGGLAKRAAEVLPLFGEGAMRNSLQGYEVIMDEMPAVKMVGKAGDIAEDLSEGVKDIFKSFQQ
jgi:hypothetical protein